MIKGFIFDMDGVIIDNHSFHYSAWFKLCEEIGHPITEDYYRDHFNGKKSEDILRMLDSSYTEDDIQRLMDQKESLYRKTYGPHQVTAPGLLEFLSLLKSAGYKMALGTSAPVPNVLFTIDGLQLRSYFDLIIDGSMVKKGKPDPEVYLKCIEGLGLEASECVVFEDAPAGLLSARQAKARRVGVINSNQKEEFPEAEQSIFNFENLTADIVQDWFT